MISLKSASFRSEKPTFFGRPNNMSFRDAHNIAKMRLVDCKLANNNTEISYN